MTILRTALVLACVGLSACAGRKPDPVAVVQEQDRHTDCQAILTEVQANKAKVAELGSEDGAKVAQNVAAGVAGLFIPVLWFAMDFQNAAGKETTALEQRNSYLARLAESRCNTPTSASQSAPRT
jgi:hypothetical protein